MSIIGDQIAEQFLFWTTDLDSITEEMRVEAAEKNDPNAARRILWNCHQQTCDSDTKVQHPVGLLLYELATGEMPLNELQKSEVVRQALRMDVPERWLRENKTKLGNASHAYLDRCFERTIREYSRPSGKHRRKKWLAIGFNLAWAKKDAEGQSDNQGRDADITQSVHLLIEQYVRKQGSLRSSIERFLNGDSDRLPSSIERLIKLKGYVGGGPYIKGSRTRVAKPCLDILKRVESAAKPSRDKDHPAQTIASEIYVECSKACKAHLLKILADIEAGRTSACCGGAEDEIIRIRERLATLNSYGAEPVGKGKKGTGAPGIAGVYSENQHRLPTPDRRRNKPKTQEQLEAEYWLLLETPVIGEAVRLIDAINSPDDCEEVFAQLNALRGRTPTGTEHMWPGLVARFNAAEDAFKERRGETTTQA